MRVPDAIGHALALAGSNDLASHLVADPGIHAVRGGAGGRAPRARSPGCLAMTAPGRWPSPPGWALRPPPACMPRGPWPVPWSAGAPASPPRWPSRSPATNLVIELGIILALLLSWQFTLAEFIGGPIMIVLAAVAFRLRFSAARLIQAARDTGGQGTVRVDGRARRDGHGHRLRRQPLAPACPAGTATPQSSHIFVMEWAAVLRDIVARTADRRGRRRLGARLVLAAPVPDRPPAGRQAVGPADRPGHPRCSASSARSAMCRWPECCATAGSASAASPRSFSPT